MLLQLAIVIFRHRVSDFSQVIVFIDQANIKPRRARGTVVAIYAGPCSIPGGESAQDGVIPLLRRGVYPCQGVLHILEISDAGQNRKHAGLVQSVLDTLDFGERLAERRCFCIQQLAGGKGLHHRNTDALRLTAAIKFYPFSHTADSKFSVLVIIRWVD